MNDTNVAPSPAVAHMTLDRFLSAEAAAGLTEEQRSLISEYLKQFAVFDDKVLRCKCGANLGTCPGDSLESMLGVTSFSWGLANGEGYCWRCEWPARGIHRIDLGEREAYWRVPLPYHPDLVEVAS